MWKLNDEEIIFVKFTPFLTLHVCYRSWLICYYCLTDVLLIVTINVLWLFLTVPGVGLQYVIVAFPDHTHLLFHCIKQKMSC